MQSVSEQFKTAIKEPSREIKSRITFPGLVLDDETIQRIEWDSTLIGSDDFEIGTAPMGIAKIEIISEADEPITYNFDGTECEIEIGVGVTEYSDTSHLALGEYTHEELATRSHGDMAVSSDEYVSLGFYTVEKAVKKDNIITLECIDRMHKFEMLYESTLAYPATLSQIAQDICTITGVDLVSASFPNSGYIVNSAPVLEGITCRKAIAQIAELAGGYARINRAGKLEIFNINVTAQNEVKYASGSYRLADTLITDELIVGGAKITQDNYIDFSRKEMSMAAIDKVVVRLGAEEATQGSGDGVYYVVDNMFCQNPHLVVEALYSTLKGLSYIPFSMKWQGDPAIDCGDMITIRTDRAYYNTMVTSRKLTYSGGLREDYEAVGKSDTAKNSTPKGSLTLDMEKAKTEIKVLDGKIEQRVTKGEFESYTEQTAEAISQKVSRGTDLQTEVTQNAESWNLSINGKLSGVRYTFDGNGFSLNDGNNQALITPAGILDTNNIARSDNVADGYPLIMRFYIDDQVNTIDKVFLRLTNEKFRAYSTGAASGGGSTSGSSSASTTSDGGGSTSGASSKSTSDSGGSSTPTSQQVSDGFVHAVLTSSVSGSTTHQHIVDEGDFSHVHKVSIGSHSHGMSHTHAIPDHSHGMAHTHSTPDHMHGQVYGIYEDAVPNNVVTVWVDGVQRASLSSQDASVNLSTWLTTKGWHTVEIRSAVRKRISAGLFIKSYIQR